MSFVSNLPRAIKANTFKICNRAKQQYECPICNYIGPFIDITPPTGFRKDAYCPNCYAAERHRLQKLVLDQIIDNNTLANTGKMLHFAPEKFFKKFFKSIFKNYTSVDLYREDVDVKADITNLPFKHEEYDFIFASHVLEHIQDDLTALSEIRRVLKPTGIAILPVPILSKTTIEYPEPNPFEAHHVRAPGFDYYDRYHNYFSRVATYSSSAFSDKYQPFVYENRSSWPTKECPLRQSMTGEKHLEIVPICFA